MTTAGGGAAPGAAPARPQRADARRNRERLLTAAAEAFAAEGIGVQVDDITRRAGVGVGTLYRHFPTKEALFEAVVLERLGAMVDEARAAGQAKEPAKALFWVLGRLLQEGIEKRDLLEALGGPGFKERMATSGIVGELERAVGDLLRRAQATGTVREDVTAAEVVGLVSGTCMAADRAHACSPELMLLIVCDGLRRRPGPAESPGTGT